MRFSTPLPIDDALPALRAALQVHTGVVLEAPPGAGKTTRVPLALLEEPWLAGRRILMLEPRRLAARSAAHFMATLRGEAVGETVGYRVRGESRISNRTRIEVVTEGVLTRLMSSDATLEAYGLVLFDEFHERSLQADLGLALVLETQTQVRDDLRIVVMSATLDGVGVAQLIGSAGVSAPVVRSEGRAFPVETFHRPPRAGDRLEQHVARVVREAIADGDGDVLVFLPGATEQRRVAERLAGDDAMRDGRVAVHQLHGSMPLTAQTAAIALAAPGTRKIVLSTSVAETSLTIEGVRTVVDAGLSRLPRYDARAGLTRLETVRVSRSSADQRRGRAGRVAAGRCYRLWDAHEDYALTPSTRAEVLDADLAPLALELADAGISDPAALRWLDVPRAGAFAQARELLTQLGALSGRDANDRITPHGRRMVALPVQPRLAHLLLGAQARGLVRLGAEIAALLEERDVLHGEGGFGAGFVAAPCDLRLRVEALRRGGAARATGDGNDLAMLASARMDRDGIARVRALADDLARRVETRALAGPPVGAPERATDTGRAADVAGAAPRGPSRGANEDIAETGALLALAFPDRVAQRRPGNEPRYLLRSGVGAALPKHDALQNAEYLAVAELDGAPPEYRIARAAPMTLAEVLQDFGDQVVRDEVVEWHESTRSVRARRRVMLGAITLEDASLRDADPARVRDVLLAVLAREGVSALPWSVGGTRARERMAFVHAHDSTWPDVSDDALGQTLGQWLGPHVDGLRKFADLERVDWTDALLAMLPWDRRQALDRLAPTHIDVPSGSRVALEYGDPSAPVLAVKLQEVFGWTSTPMLLDGRVPLTLHLLSPARRPVQVTRDLAGFWKGSYFEVRKELRGRYPRHPWPDDPLSAPATRRAKPRGT